MTLRVAPLAHAGLVGLACLNAALLALTLGPPAPEAEVKAAIATAKQPPGSPKSDLGPPKRKPITAYGETLARPVFFKSRAPYVPPPPAPPPPPKPVAAPPPAPVDPGLVLGGVVIWEETKKAYIFNKADSRGAWLSEGETILGWRVESIDVLTARLQQAGRAIELQLYPKR
jgi:hypothetical protein